MSSGTLVEVHRQDGRPVLTKTATTSAARSRLERETERLQRASHPGVVELIEVGEDPDLRITLAWAGVRTLETLHPPLPVAAALLASLAETVADLHALGIVHGRIDASHVIVDGEGRPRLCGLAGSDDPAIGAADDVAAVGRLMDLLVGADAEPEPIPERRWTRRRWTGFARRSLQTLADQANHPEPEHRPTARQLARSIVEAIPEARLAAPAAEPARPAEPARVAEPRDDPGFDLASPGETEHVDVATPTVAASGDAGGDEASESYDDQGTVDPPLDEAPVGAATADEAPGTEAPHDDPRADEAERIVTPVTIPRTFLGMRVLDAEHGATAEPEPGGQDASATEDDASGGSDALLPPPLDRPLRNRPTGDRRRRPGVGSLAPVERVAAAAVVVILALLMAAVGMRLLDRSTAQAPNPVAGGAAATVPGAKSVPTSTTSMPTAARSPVSGRPACPPVTGTAVNLDADGCAHAVRVHDTAVQIGSAHFQIGRSGDRIAVGDWNCDGHATPAIVRPSTGEVFVFPSWAGKGKDLTIAPAAVVAEATTPADPKPGTCGPLRVRRSNGTEATVSSARSGK